MSKMCKLSVKNFIYTNFVILFMYSIFAQLSQNASRNNFTQKIYHHYKHTLYFMQMHGKIKTCFII